MTAAKRHGMPTAAVVVATPLDQCLQRQAPRRDNRRVPEDVVRTQHQAMVHSHQRLAAEGFNTVVFADTLDRLEPFLRRLSQVREADLGRDGNEGLGDLLLVRRFFGPEILPLWRWRPDSDLVTGRDQVAELRLGRQSLTLAFRDDIDGEGDFGFDVALPCPADPECAGQAWAPAARTPTASPRSQPDSATTPPAMRRSWCSSSRWHGCGWTNSGTGSTAVAASWPTLTWPAPSTTSAGPGCDEPAMPRVTVLRTAPPPADPAGPGRPRWSLTTDHREEIVMACGMQRPDCQVASRRPPRA